MAKWFNEIILIKYWEDRCHKYSLRDGTKIKSSFRNRVFGKYPDIERNELSDNRIVPAEIEWLTKNFDRHGHNIEELIKSDGFLIVYKKDQEHFPVEQVEIDREDLINWMEKKSKSMLEETLNEIEKSRRVKLGPQIYLFYLPKSAKKNVQVALEKGVWGWPENSLGVTRGLTKLMSIKKGDILVILSEWKKDPKIKGVSGGRVSSDKYIGQFKEIIGLRVTKGYHKKNIKNIWEDGVYPHRVNFRKEILFKGQNIPCNKKDLGKSLHETLRQLQINGSVKEVDTSMIVKLMSLC